MNNIFSKLRLLHSRHIGIVPLWIVCLTISLMLWAVLWHIPTWLELSIFVLLMISVGIPHGAVDHLVYFSQHNKSQSIANWLGFYRFYLGVIFFYALAWWLFPMLCFVLFLLFSAYHFGQSQLYYLSGQLEEISKKILYFSWGLGILGALFGFQQAQTIEILRDTPFAVLLENSLAYSFGFQITVWSIFLFILMIALFQHQIHLNQLLQEIFLVILLMLLFAQTSLLWSFSIYFALWHSLQTITHEITVFNTSKQERIYTWKNYFRDALPFSLMSFLGIGLIGLALYFFEFEKSHLLFTFFVLISLLTAPHAFLMEKIYQEGAHPS